MKNFLLHLLTWVLQRLARTSARQTGGSAGGEPHGAASPPRLSLPPPSGPSADAAFTGSAEEAAIHLHPNIPPVMKVTYSLFARATKDGPLPKSLEQVRLTQQGREISHADVIMLDGFNQIGKPENLAGFCAFCDRFAFTGRPCAGCATFVCPVCGRPLDEMPEAPIYCPQCWRAAVLNRLNWPGGDA